MTEHMPSGGANSEHQKGPSQVDKIIKVEMSEMADLAMFFNRCYTQLIHRFPQPD
jgi:hypothetical protein